VQGQENEERKSWVFMRETSVGVRKRELYVCVREFSVCERVRNFMSCYVQQHSSKPMK
jgi:hypothetical protein